MRAMILAAGFGTRLFPLTLLRAKPSVPFLNRPLLQYSLDLIMRAGISDIAINLYHLPQTVIQAVPSETQIHYSRERTILGTGGALDGVRDWSRGDDFLVCNGKIYFEEDLKKVIEYHRKTDAMVTLVLVPHAPRDPFRPVFLNSQQNITCFGETRRLGERDEPFTFTGVHVLSSRVWDFLPQGQSDTVRDLYPLLIQLGHRVKGFVSDAYWCECSTPSRYLTKSVATLGHTGRSNLIAETTSAHCRGVVAASGVHIGSGSTLRNCVLWKGSGVGRDCCLADVIITSGVELPSGTRLQEAIVTLPVSHSSNPPPRVLAGTEYSIWTLKEDI